MRLSAKTEYAALAALELARRGDAAAPVRIREICAAQGVPPRFLVHILLQLKAAGIVASIRGAAGGYRLAKPADEVTLLDLRAAVEGAGDGVAPFLSGVAKRSRVAAVLAAAWETAAEAEAESLAEITLASLAAKCRSAGDSMYYI
ncbi:MAG: RrF2 family transcriptional regulator [Pirellulales bacterium]